MGSPLTFETYERLNRKLDNLKQQSQDLERKTLEARVDKDNFLGELKDKITPIVNFIKECAKKYYDHTTVYSCNKFYSVEPEPFYSLEFSLDSLLLLKDKICISGDFWNPKDSIVHFTIYVPYAWLTLSKEEQKVLVSSDAELLKNLYEPLAQFTAQDKWK